MTYDLSPLGDAALLVPAAIVILAFFAAMRRVPTAIGFAAALVFVAAVTVAAKLVFKTCGGAISDMDVASPSGHVSLAAAFYGSLAVLFATGRPRWQQAGIGIATAALVAGIGWGRVTSRSHSPEEVLAGVLIGIAAIALFGALHARAGAPTLSPWPLVAAFGLVAAFLVGHHVTVEPVLGRFARELRSTLDICADAPPSRRRQIRLGDRAPEGPRRT